MKTCQQSRNRIFKASVFFALLLFLFSYSCSELKAEESGGLDVNTIKSIQNVSKALKKDSRESYAEHIGKGEIIAVAAATLTGEAVNPMFGVTARSIYVYYDTDEIMRQNLSWYYQPKFWVPMGLFILAMFFKGTVGEAAPFLKKPLDAASDLVSKAGGLASLPIIVSMFAGQISEPVKDSLVFLQHNFSGVAMAAEQVVNNSEGGSFLQTVSYIISAAIGSFIYIIIWLCFNTFEVLILVSPFPIVDAGLKTFRLTVMGAIAGITALNPWAGLAVSAVLALICFFIAGWSLRLSVFGLIYSTDIIFLRSRRTRVSEPRIKVFSNHALRKKVPARTYGKLLLENGKLVFKYRPWLIMPLRTLELEKSPGKLEVGDGLFNAYIICPESEGYDIFFRLPPKYNKCSFDICNKFGFLQVRDISVLRGLKNLFGFIRDAFSGRDGSAAV